MDKETKEAFKQNDNKIEDLRKQTMGEINRIEAMLEKESQDKMALFDALKESIDSQLSEKAKTMGDVQHNLG